MAEPLALLDEGLVAHVAPVRLHHDVGGRVFCQVGLGGEEPATQLARQLRRGLHSNLGSQISNMCNKYELGQGCHRELQLITERGILMSFVV